MAGSGSKFGSRFLVSRDSKPPNAQEPVMQRQNLQDTECPNSGWWRTGRCRDYIISFENTKPQPAAGQSIESQLRQAISDFFSQSGVTPCQSPKCEKFRKACELAIPECKWTKFRSWVVNWIACWMQSQNPSVLFLRRYPSTASNFLTRLLSQPDTQIRSCSLCP